MDHLCIAKKKMVSWLNYVSLIDVVLNCSFDVYVGLFNSVLIEVVKLFVVDFGFQMVIGDDCMERYGKRYNELTYKFDRFGLKGI
jgi:hypothetical protein